MSYTRWQIASRQMVRCFGLAALGTALLTASTAAAQVPAKGDLLFEDNFVGSTLGTSWTASGGADPVVSNGAVVLSNGTDLLLSGGFLECPVIFELEDVQFGSMSGNGSSAGFYLRTLGNGSVSTYGGSQSFSWSLQSNQYMNGYGYGQNGLEGFLIVDQTPTLDTAVRTYTMAMETTGSVLHASGWPSWSSLGGPVPTPNSGRSTIGFNTNGTASISCGRVRVWRSIPSPIRVVQFIEARTTATLDFSSAGLTAVSSNSSFTTYGTLTVDKITSAPPTLPHSALNNTVWNVTMSPSNLSSITTMTAAFNVADVTALGGTPASLKGYKSSDNGASWTEVPNCVVSVNGAAGTFTFGGQSSFSLFAIGSAPMTAAREWQLFE